MQSKYYELKNAVQVSGSQGLKIPSARNIATAIQSNRDYQVIDLLSHSEDGSLKYEYIVVDVECDEVLPNNSPGIEFKERLALRVSKDPRKLVEVLALRKDFPILMHQNQVPYNSPASLCLYFEPAVSVMRTWTPHKFLRRIQWWLINSANEELHVADQPLEQLFFQSIYELVIPIDFKDKKSKNFIAHRSHQRLNGGFSFILTEDMSTQSNVNLLYIELPTIVHDRIEGEPQNLGELQQILSNRQIDLIEHINSSVAQLVDANGIGIDKDNNQAILLLRIPISRDQDNGPERITYRAFLFLKGVYELGYNTGALIQHDGKYYQYTPIADQAPSTLDWENLPLLPMQVLWENNHDSARLQSGISEKGPKSALIGVGSLGSALLNLWHRSGWGHWTIIDNDHIKPHNLSRHTAFFCNIGQPKVDAVSELQAASRRDTEVQPILADATDLDTTISERLSDLDLVIDASTTLEYPRIASNIDKYPRHASTFVTHNGCSSVLLFEDESRTIRLRTLEAQYYRALIQNKWGKDHLGGVTSTFWSGAGCRDISLVMPYSSVLVHASNLAEQIQIKTINKEASICIWERNSKSGEIAIHDIEPHKENCIQKDGYSVFYDDGIEETIKELRQQQLPDETGGILLGYFDLNINTIVIVDVLPAPPDSKGSKSSFERGVSGLEEQVQEASKRTAGIVTYIGEWHSHPDDCSTALSNDDIVQLSYLAEKMKEDGLPVISLIANKDDLGIYIGELY
ncbi:ThiF family adenylyltransferase [Kangiella sp. HZ709]|uniref:ThiF family adenylyltransferase n=1 Tax=Kangiella sp. HZ709 TaxID=2666328 RepID=UPI0012AF1134|nr:ThiF family adenylyltransferase [Kangiella sp. HZ709]MRX27292.1 hypothetical protein [Kangiella sp. HZ709]